MSLKDWWNFNICIARGFAAHMFYFAFPKTIAVSSGNKALILLGKPPTPFSLCDSDVVASGSLNSHHSPCLESVIWFKPGQSVYSIPLASVIDSWISQWDSTAVCWQCWRCKLQINLIDFRFIYVLRLNGIIKTLSFSIFGPVSFDVASFSGSFIVSGMSATSRTLLWHTIHMSNFAESLVGPTCLHIPPLGPITVGNMKFYDRSRLPSQLWEGRADRHHKVYSQ